MRNGMTITDLSEEIGVSVKTIRLWIAGNNVPAIKTPGNTVVFNEDDVATIKAVFGRYGYEGMRLGLARRAAELA